MVHQVMTNLVK